jgi:hypothetical protein
MSDERVTPKREEIPPDIQALVDAGWGTVELQHDPEGRYVIGFHSLPLSEMERMGEEERIRLGVQADYLGLIAFINDAGSRPAD